MIPVSLRVRNFLPYKGETLPLSFVPIHTACISGDNGAGKSSIIDAITWALWGKSRAKSDDDLIHQGENETEVEFDFCASEQLYRVIRRHSRPKGKRSSGQSSLDLYIFKGDKPLPLTTDRIRHTEDKLKSILHMDYDTFINSAYLRQGHADEFTRQDPSKRKDVLASILGLEIYDRYEECAKEKYRIAQQTKIQIGNSINVIKDKLEQKPLLETDLLQIETRYKTITVAIINTKNTLEELRQKENQLSAIQAQLTQIKTAIERNGEDLRRKTELYQKSLERIDSYKTLLERHSDIETQYQQLQVIREQCEKMDQQVRQIARLREECKPYEKICANAKNELLVQYGTLKKENENLENKIAQIPMLKAKQQELERQRQDLAQSENIIEKNRESLREYEAEFSRLNDATKRARQDIADIEEKQRMLDEAQSEIFCPLCESDLGKGRLELVQNKYSSDKATKLNIISENNDVTAMLGAKIELDKADLLQQEYLAKKTTSELHRQEENLTRDTQEAADATETIKKGMLQLESIRQQLATNDYAHTEQDTIARIETKIASLSYDEKHHDELQKKCEQLQGSEKRKQQLDEAIILLQKEQENAASYTEDAAKIQKQQSQDNQTAQLLTQQMQQWPELRINLKQAEDSFEKQLSEQKDAGEKIAIIREKIRQITDMEKEFAEKHNEFATIAENESLYKQLAQVFGKKGLQATLIETILPEIESEANFLLGRMTDGRMTLAFETQQVTKKGDTTETLDIKIADELGTRSYELFSGGEGFRIDFAVRIALSRLLAQRAGAPLPTLIIDEGFGTQDTDGIEKLKEAINSIQNDFQKILVVTHIDELKDAFPVRINVVKAAEGSTINIT